MQNGKVVTIFLLLVAASLSAQQLPATKPNLKWLQRDVEHLHELDSKNAVGVVPGLTVEERRELILSFEKDLRPSMKELSIGSEEELRKAVVENTFVEKIDLDGDGIPEIIVQGVGNIWGGSPTGNGPIWVLKKTSKGYRTLIDSLGQRFTVLEAKTNGFLNLMIGMHGSATMQELKIYHFRDGRYFEDGCFEANWSVLVNGEVRDLRKPLITKCGS